RDDDVTDLKSSDSIRILQWGRYCFENYLIDLEVIGALLQEKEYVVAPIKSQGEVAMLLKGLAMSQIDERAGKLVYTEMNYQSPGLRGSEIRGASLDGIADNLYSRLVAIKAQLQDLDDVRWKRNFVDRCMAKKSEIEQIWESNWLTECSGKQLFSDLQSKVQLKCSLLKFKRDVLIRMGVTPPKEGWNAIGSQLKQLLGIGGV